MKITIKKSSNFSKKTINEARNRPERGESDVNNMDFKQLLRNIVTQHQEARKQMKRELRWAEEDLREATSDVEYYQKKIERQKKPKTGKLEKPSPGGGLPGEDVITIGSVSQQDLKRLEVARKRQQEKEKEVKSLWEAIERSEEAEKAFRHILGDYEQEMPESDI